MMSKPPFGLSASGQTSGSDSDLEDLSDEIDVDSSQDVTVEASEESTLEVSAEDSDDESTLEVSDEFGVENTETPPPLSALMPHGMPGGIRSGSHELMASTPPPRRMQTILGLPLPSLPLPGVTASRSAPGLELADDDDDDEVTVMARPSVTDDEEESTKVEPAATALHAAASRDGDDDEVTTALSAQASVEREKALRKSVPPSLDLPLPSPSYRTDSAGDDGDEFEDPEDDDVELAHDTPAVISVDNDAIATSSYSADDEEPSSELEAVLAPRRPTGSPPLGSAIGSFGRGGEGFGAARLPTPSPGYGFSLPSPGQLPAPSNSPFSARTAPVGSPYAATRTTSAPMPAIQIPAPSGAAALPSSRSGMFFAVQVPVVGLLALIVAAGGGGVLLGAKLWRSGAPVAMPPATLATAPVSAPVVQPTAPTAAAPSAATPVAAAPAAAPPVAPAPSVAVPAPAAAPVAEEAAPVPAARPVKRAATRPLARRTPALGASAGGNPAPAKARPAKVAKVAKGWVDPFAE
jgi:hypothetical protein